MKSQQALKKLNTYFQDIIEQGFHNNETGFPVDPDSLEAKELKTTFQHLSLLFEMMNEASSFSEQLAKGNLQTTASRNNIFTMPMKGLQASLAHLTWQADRVAEGDLNQQVYFLGAFSDSFNRMIESLQEKQVLEQRLKVITDVLGDGVLFIDKEGHLLFANPEALKLLEYSVSEINEKDISSLFQAPASGENLFKDSILKGKNYDEENGVITAKSGKEIPVMLSSRPVYKKKSLDGSVITIRDITEQRKYLLSLETINKLLEKQAMTDALTGIHNRMKFDRILAGEIQRTRRNKYPLSLIMCDIDHFKQINDQYGHPAGDAVLKRLTKLIKQNIRNIDFFARWGGEEFVILSPGTDSNGSEQLAEKIRLKIESFNFTEPEHLTLSFGISSFKTGDNAVKLLNRADEAMYKAKANGRNQVQVSQEEL